MAVAFFWCLCYHILRRTGGIRVEILALVEAGRIDTAPLITHRYRLEDIEEPYHLFENKLDGVIKIAVAT